MDIEALNNLYKTILTDILQGKNIIKHQQDVEELIKILDERIADANSKGEKTDGFEKLKNEIYFLKYQIAEKL